MSVAFPPQLYLETSFSDTQEFPDGPLYLDFVNHVMRIQKKSPEVGRHGGQSLSCHRCHGLAL